MKTIVFTLLLFTIAVAQTRDPEVILNKVKDEFSKIEDYEVDVKINIDINFLKVPESKAKIYFKQPDKVKLKSEGFALLPREGLNFCPAKLLNNDYTAIYSKLDSIDGRYVDVIKVIPTGDSSDVVLTSLWVDSTEHVLRKIESTTKRSGTFTIRLDYEDISNLHLPSEVAFSFNVSDMQLPKSLTGDFDAQPVPKKEDGKQMKGTVTVTYSNYKVNQGLPDSIFEDEEDTEKK
jgi:outer membrane lipoprotein-sorting protein